MDLGNPPGKQHSYGDAINWESLLQNTDDEKDLCLVTDDGDYRSVLNDERLNEYLLREWKEDKKGELKFYRRLSAFFKDNYPDIELRRQRRKPSSRSSPPAGHSPERI